MPWASDFPGEAKTHPTFQGQKQQTSSFSLWPGGVQMNVHIIMGNLSLLPPLAAKS